MTEENTSTEVQTSDPVILTMFEAGAHFGYSRGRRHPSMADVMFGIKNRVEVFDLEKTKSYLSAAKAFAENVGAMGKQILFVSGKHEAKAAIKAEAEGLAAPYVAGRWLGGTLTNFSQMKVRMAKLVDLRDKRVKGELAKYTKKEQLLIDRQIATLEDMFAGLLPMKELPGAVFVIDSKNEKTAVSEAKKIHVPVIALMSSDCDMDSVEYPIPANDSSSSSVQYFVKEIADSFRMGKTRAMPPSPKKA
ncbi:MAG: 30S ribosomal protein S2 [Candidatus Taylorbacteria bacterium]|nr:30S ribosomal protein S2 [Candidatus Taylorbacteria bacterium]